MATVLRQPPTGLRTLTLANVITDAVRQANIQGDGLPIPSGFGVWPAATNIVTQSIPGALATTGVTKAGDAAATLTKVTDATAPFQASSADVWLLDNSAGSTDATVDFNGNATAAAYTGSVWAKKIAGSPTVSIEGGGTPTAISGTASYARYAQSLTANLNDNLRVTAPAGAVVRFTAGQLETGPIATPFVVTNGGTASRSAGRARVESQGLFTATQGAVFARLSLPYANTALPNVAPRVLQAALTGLFQVWVNGSGINIQTQMSGGAAAVNATQALVWVAGGHIGVGAAWTATQLAASGNGAAQTTAVRSELPTMLPTVDLFDSGDGARELTGNALFAVLFKGAPTNADWALLHSFGDTVPTLEQIRQLSPGSKPTLLIPAKTADAVLLPAYFGGS